jgi:flagellar motor protein MotB
MKQNELLSRFLVLLSQIVAEDDESLLSDVKKILNSVCTTPKQEQAGKQASKQASKQTSKQTSTKARASKQAPKQEQAQAPKQEQAQAPKQEQAQAPKQEQAQAPKQDQDTETRDYTFSSFYSECDVDLSKRKKRICFQADDGFKNFCKSHTALEISREYKISTNTVYKLAKKHNLTIPNQKSLHSEKMSDFKTWIQDEDFINFCSQSTINEISEFLGLSYVSTYRNLMQSRIKFLRLKQDLKK